MKISREIPLKNIKKLGKYINPRSGQPVDVYIGYKPGKTILKTFYRLHGYRIVITQKEFRNWEKL